MNADIRVFPAAELSDLDFAELMNAALVYDGRIQGCTLSVTNHELNISSGRLVIKGRLAVVTAGQIERPSDVLSNQTCYVCAICDLSAENPFTIENLRSGDYDTLVERAGHYNNFSFNVNNGVAYFLLGTTVVDPSLGVTSVTPSTSPVAKNIFKTQALDSEITTIKDSGSSALSLATLNSWITYLKKRAFAESHFDSEAKAYDGLVVGAGKMITVRFRSGYNSFNRMVPYASTDTSAAAQNAKVQAIQAMQTAISNATQANTSKQAIVIFNDGVNADTAEFEGTWGASNDEYGVPTTIDTRRVPIGISSVVVSNASSGGTNYTNCLIQTFGSYTGIVYARIVNTGNAQAKIKAEITVTYITKM